jgi:hypothetical protein
MNKKTELLKSVLVSIALVGGLSWAASAPSSASSTTTIPSSSTPSRGLIGDGPSRVECLEPNVIGSGLGALQSSITSFEEVTGTLVSCVSAYLNGALTWSQWVHPWVSDAQIGYSTWVAESPQSRELVLQVDLIPISLKNVNDPLSWERSCAAGKFDSYANQLGNSLVAAGLQNSVIRLGPEMNGTWETDFVGTTRVEQRLWARCFDNEVTGIRRAVGGHFLIDWNPNACKFNIPYLRFYPGNSYVDIMGLDVFDVSCVAPQTPYAFSRLEHEPAGLSSFESFAAAHKKPMSLPEWGLSTIPTGDDPKYIDGIGSAFDTMDFSFETYFDSTYATSGKALPLGPRTPLSVAEFRRWFGSSAKS